MKTMSLILVNMNPVVIITLNCSPIHHMRQKANVKQLPSVDKKLAKDVKRQAEILAKNKVIAEKNCQAAKVNIKTLNTFNRISISDPDGNSRVLTDKEKQEQITLSNKHIDLYCNGADS